MNKITKEQLQKLLDNVDMEKLNSEYLDNTVYPYVRAVEKCLYLCQKEPSLHDKLLARGFYLVAENHYRNSKRDGLSPNIPIIHIYSESKIIELCEYKNAYGANNNLRCKNEQQLFEAIGLFEKWVKDESSNQDVLNGNDMPW